MHSLNTSLMPLSRLVCNTFLRTTLLQETGPFRRTKGECCFPADPLQLTHSSDPVAREVSEIVIAMRTRCETVRKLYSYMAT